MAMLEEKFVPLDLVNTVRERVKAWHKQGYPGVTLLTWKLLNHWNNPERERRLFFCQRETAETLIWLVEASPAEKQGIGIPKDNGLTRYACKIATGSGKTVVMGMVIAWQVLNKLVNPQDRQSSDAVFLVYPNLTIRERLQVLLPRKPGNYYKKFDLVPRGMMERLQQGKFEMINWHLF
jgi:type III restriction enzyme